MNYRIFEFIFKYLIYNIRFQPLIRIINVKKQYKVLIENIKC
jgi:hypothetical protein